LSFEQYEDAPGDGTGNGTTNGPGEKSSNQILTPKNRNLLFDNENAKV
jgi:hypothetical protein